MSDSKEWLMTFIAVRCPHCDSEQIVKRGKTYRGTQRYLCQNMACAQGSFLLDYRNRGCLPEVKQQIIGMSLNASGVRDTAWVLRISTDTVLSELKKKEVVLESANTALLHTINPDDIAVHIEGAGEAEMDEMWSFVTRKRSQEGSGMPLITVQEPSWRMSLASAKMQSFCG
jgi:transposase-like protein